MRIVLLILLFVNVAVLCAKAQNVKLITTENGLSNALINQVFQDSRGYIWITTEDGLNRYDGVTMKVYHSEEMEGSLSSDYVRRIYEDKQGDLWIGSKEGLQQFSIETEKFVDIPLIVGTDTVKAHVTDIVEDIQGNIWVATSGRGIFCFDSSGREVSCNYFNDLPNIDHISSIAVDANNTLWVVAYLEGIYSCNLSDGSISFVDIDEGNEMNENTFVYKNGSDVYLCVGKKSLYHFDRRQNKFIKVPLPPEVINQHSSIMSLCVKDNLLFIGTDGSGFFIYDMLTKVVNRSKLYCPQMDMSKAKIHTILFDNNENLWLGIFQQGVLLAPVSQMKFIRYGYHPNGRYNIGSNCVISLLNDAKGLWIGTDSDGLYYIDESGNVQHLTNVSSKVMAMLPRNDNQIWLADYAEGLKLFDKRTGSCTDYNSFFSKEKNEYNRRTIALASDGENRLWIGTYGCGVFVMDQNNNVKSYRSTTEVYDSTLNEPINNWINCIYVDNQKIWMGTYNGVSCYNLETERFDVVDKSIRDIVERSVIYDITSKNGMLYFASNKGLIEINKTTHDIRRIDQRDGLASNSAVALACDSIGKIWVSTNGGISCYDTETKNIDSYYSHSGIQGDEYSRSSVAIANDGLIYFGGTRGVTGINPYTVKPDNIPLNLQITRFLINGREIKLGDTSNGESIVDVAVPDASKFTISYAEKSFAFDLTTFTFVNTQQIRYEYMFDEIDSEWRTMPWGISQLNFSNFRPGTYQLKLRACMGSTLSPTKSVTIVVRPLWWQTNWAYIIYITIISLIIYVIYRFSQSQQRIREKIIEQEHERNISEAKFQFFFNISHEIRTPLTLILNPLRELIAKSNTDDKVMHSYKIIYRNSERILRLINQMLDLRKIEKGQMEMHFVHTDIKQFIETVRQSFNLVSDKRNVNFEIYYQLVDPVVDIDIDNFDKAIYNIYSNALKFTPENSSIDTLIKEDGENIIISISDCGPGIEVSQLERIFDRFYQVENTASASYTGTGIGLHLTRDIVTLHKGTITASNKEIGTGAVFTIRIPRKQKGAVALDANKIAEIQAKTAEISVVNVIDQPDKHRAATNKNVIIVDDEPEVLSYLTEELSTLYRVTTCTNGKDAYSLLLKRKFDIVISDVMMPQMNGFDLCKKIKSNGNINHIPVVLLTAKHSDEDLNSGLRMGADAYIAKPFDINTLRNTIKSILDNRDRVLLRVNSAMEQPEQLVAVKSSDEVLIEKVKKYVDEHLSESTLNVEAVASYVGMSRVHLHRKLKELTGQSARDYIRTLRLRNAGALFREKKLSVSEVAFALGFSNLSHFSSLFHDFYGMSPKEYINSNLTSDSETEKGDTE